VFWRDRVEIHPEDPTQIPEVAEELPLADRIAATAARAPQTPEELAQILEANQTIIERIVRRYRGRRFIVLDGGRVGLAAPETANTDNRARGRDA